MEELPPVLVVDLFPDERAALLALLSALSEEDWTRPTACSGWSVKDVALHILGDDVGVLSRRRDDHRISQSEANSWQELVEFVDRWNALWVEATRRLSPRLLLDFLRYTGEETHRYFKSLNPFELGQPVSWAGPEPAPVWLDIAREYTERWLHQQHVRGALAKPGLKDRRLFGPVLETFVRALSHTYRDVKAQDGAQVKLIISGAAGGEWLLVRKASRWVLGTNAERAADATVYLDQETAWQLFTNGLDRVEVAQGIRIDGDRALGANVLDTRSIIA